MAYPSKIARHCERLDRAYDGWLRSLAAKSLDVLSSDLRALEARLAGLPARHTRLIESAACRARVLRAVVAEREAQK